MREDEAMHHAIVEEPECEYIDGRAYQKVSPKKTHAAVQLAIGAIVRRCADGRGIAGSEWNFRLTADTLLLPDVAFVYHSRLDALEDHEDEEPPFAPDIAVEVRSPSYRAAFAAEKISLYLLYGAQLVLDVDPMRRAIDAYAPNEMHVCFGSGDRFAMPQVPWLQFNVEEIFADLDRRR